jgi:hypothetical protein
MPISDIANPAAPWKDELWLQMPCSIQVFIWGPRLPPFLEFVAISPEPKPVYELDTNSIYLDQTGTLHSPRPPSP